MSYSRDHVINSLMYAVGFEPIELAARGSAEVMVSAERLADYDADVLLVYPYGRTEDELRQEVPTLAGLESVRGGTTCPLLPREESLDRLRAHLAARDEEA